MSCLRMSSCCCCLNTAKGSILAAVSTIAAALVTFICIVLGLVYWDEFSAQIYRAYKEIGLGEDTIETTIKIVWWGNIFSLIVIVLYIVLSILLIIGVRREQYKHMIPWISATFMLLPFFTVSFLIQLIFGIVGVVGAVIIPAVVVLVWCGVWAYGFFCAVSHYRMLKGDIHYPVAQIFRRS